MKVNLTYEEALSKASPLLREKMRHSVELLRKSERIALKYSDEGFMCGFSGGKDSQACYHIAQLAGVKMKAHFSPTSVDPPEVIRFIKTEYPEVEFRKLTTNIYKEALKMGCLPTMRIRWCCAVFKEGAYPGTVNIVGVRKSESARRSRRNEVEVAGRKFSGDLETFGAWSEAKADRIRKKLEKIPSLNQDQFSGGKESEIRCINGKDKIIIMPILEWTDDDVWEFLNNVIEVPHCSLYDEGRKRIGCIMCPYSSRKTVEQDMIRWPYVKDKWLRVIELLIQGGITQRSKILRSITEYLRTMTQEERKNCQSGHSNTPVTTASDRE